jgi:hypothetical protein
MKQDVEQGEMNKRAIRSDGREKKISALQKVGADAKHSRVPF